MFNEMRWTSRWLNLDTLFTMNIGGVYQRRLYLRDAIYEVLDTHLLDSSIEYYQYCWILLDTAGYFWKLREAARSAPVDSRPRIYICNIA
jgi:hypothetical protein